MEKYSFFDSVEGDRIYNAESFSNFWKRFLQSGIFPNPSTSLQVLANDSYVVSVQPGYAMTEGYMYENTDVKNITLDVADGVLNRIDLVVVQLDLPNRKIETIVKKGLSATTPVAPTVERTEAIYELALAEVYIGKNTASISQMNITDTRMDSTRAGWVNSTIQADTTTIFNQFQSWYNTKTAQYQADWEAFFGGAKELNDPNKQNKVTYGADFPTAAAADGDLHIIVEATGISKLYRFDASVNDWTMVLSTDANDIQYYNMQTQSLNSVMDDIWDLQNEIKPFVQTFKPTGDTTLPSNVYTEIAFGTQTQKNWNNSLNCYVIPVTGQYIIQVDYQIAGLTATSTSSKSVFAKFTLNGVEKELAFDYAYGPSIGFGGHTAIQLTAGDQIKFSAYATGGGYFDGGSWSKATIQLVQAGETPQIP